MVFRPSRGDAPARIGPGVTPQHPPVTQSISADVYRDPMRYELEVEHVLRASWLIAGRSSEMANDGDWITYEGHGDTVIVNRLPDGGVAAFHNVCQHRGARLTRGMTSGCDRRFTCPWHGWQFNVSTGHHCLNSRLCQTRYEFRIEDGKIVAEIT